MKKDKTEDKLKFNFTKVKETYENAKNVLANLEHFVETASLLVLAYAGFWTALNVSLRTEYKYVLLFSAVVVALRGVSEFLKQLNKR